MTCVYAGGRLAAYLDNELSVDHPIAIDSHFAECQACAGVVREGRELSEVVKSVGDGLPDSEVVEQVRASGEMVLSRVSAEQEVARTTGIRRLVEDVHLVWLASVACVATAVCALLATAVVGSDCRGPMSGRGNIALD